MSTRIAPLLVTGSMPLVEVLKRQDEAPRHGLPGGIALVVDDAGVLVGTVTDGDVRRGLLRTGSLAATAADVMRKDPITFPDTSTIQELVAQLPQELERRGRTGTRFLGKIVLVDDAGKPTRVLDYHQLWEQRVATHRHVVVVGLGYVGLTLALELAEEGFKVTGVDADAPRIADLKAGRSYVHEVGLPALLREQIDRRFFPTTTVPAKGDVYIVAVGTPVRNDNGVHAPELTALHAAIDAVGAVLSPGDLVVLRSTVPVGTTREIVAPRLATASGGLRPGIDFHLAFAPERTVEGKALQELRTLPQVIGGINEDSVEATVALFREIVPMTVRVESLEAAELAKLINNGFRDLIFAFSNQVARMAAQFNLDATEVIRAANRGYPRDPVPLPSPGVGGPCLTKDPWILAALGVRAGEPAPLSAVAREVNESMHGFVADALLKELGVRKKPAKDAVVLVCGLAFKGQPETGDLRDSSAVSIAQGLMGKVREVRGHDAVATREDIAALGITPVSLPDGFAGADAVMFLNNHASYAKVDAFAMVRAMNKPAIIYDAWRTFRADDVLSIPKASYLGLGFSRRS